MTTLPEEAVKAAQNAIRTANWEYGITDADMAKAITAALPFLPVQGAVKGELSIALETASRGEFKALHWHDVEAVCSWCYAKTPVGEYSITWSFNESGQKLHYPDGTTKQFDGVGYGDRDAAKAAAQADYEARILSALEPDAARELMLYEGDDICARLKGLASWLDSSQHSKWCGRKEVPIHGYSGEGKLVRAAIAAIRSLSSPDHADAGKVEGDGWRPIESAPKDGTPVLAYQAGRYFKCWLECDRYEGGYFWQDEEDSEPSPTHWRPLPSAPASEGAK